MILDGASPVQQARKKHNLFAEGGVRSLCGRSQVDRQRCGLGVVHVRTDDVPGVDVDHHVAVEVLALDRAGQLGVRSVRSAVPVFRPARFCGPPPKPDVRLLPHPALHVITPKWLMPVPRSSMVSGCACRGSGDAQSQSVAVGTSRCGGWNAGRKPSCRHS